MWSAIRVHWSDAPLLVAGLLIAVLSMYAALDLAGRMRAAMDRLGNLLWLVAGALTLGSGIWAVHFVGSSTIELPFPARYQPWQVVGSWMTAVALSALVLGITRRRRIPMLRLLSVLLLVVFGAGAVHYVGTSALLVSPRLPYDERLVAAVALVALAGSAAVCWMAMFLRTRAGVTRVRRQLAAAVAFGGLMAAVNWMATAALRPAAALADTSAGRGVEADQLAGISAVALTVYLSVMILVTTLDRRATRRTRLLGASLEKTEEALRFITLTDHLTGLPNRLVFQDRLQQAVARIEGTGRQFAVFFVDLGHAAGLRHVWSEDDEATMRREGARRLQGLIREADTVASIGGDQFLVLLNEPADATIASRIADEAVGVLGHPVDVDGRIHRFVSSIGIALYPADGPASAMVTKASSAMQAARRIGGRCYRFFEGEIDAEARARSEMAEELRHAVERGQLELHYQPKVHASSEEMAGAEALLRWRHPIRGMISPTVFIPLAEQFGLIQEIGDWVIQEACRQIGAWCKEGYSIRVAINVSPWQLRDAGLAERIESHLRHHRVDPTLLTCEVTESAAMDDAEASVAHFEKLQQAGVSISIDDFGTGYSSLSYLRKLPVRQVKIDRSFVIDLCTSVDARAVVSGIIQLAHALRLEVVAEGVETAEQKVLLCELGCDKLQGYLFGKPMTPAALSMWSRLGQPVTPMS